MPQLPRADVVDGELFAGTTFAFDLVFWKDAEKTIPHPVQSFKCSIYADGSELLDMDNYTTVDSTNTNIVHVSVPPTASQNLSTVIAQWQGVTTFVDGEVRPAFSGNIQIWRKRVD